MLQIFWDSVPQKGAAHRAICRKFSQTHKLEVQRTDILFSDIVDSAFSFIADSELRLIAKRKQRGCLKSLFRTQNAL